MELGHLPVGVAPGHELEHLELALGEVAQHLSTWAAAGRRGPAGGVLEEAPGHRRREQRVARGHGADGVDDVAALASLRRKPLEAPARRAVVDVLVEVEGGQDEHPAGAATPGPARVGGGVDPVEHGHADVHEHDVGADPAGHLDRLPPVGGLAPDLDVGLGVEDGRRSRPGPRLVVGDDDPDGRRPSYEQPPIGRRTATRKPPSGAGPT